MSTPAAAEPHPGLAAGAVLRAARSAAGLSEAQLAAAADAGEAAIRAWEDGSRALASAPYPRVERIAAALRAAGSDPRLVADLDAAAWCDLVILALTGDGDLTSLLAEPIACGESFRELLAWCLTGAMPDRYRPYAAADGPLTDAPTAATAARVAQLLDFLRDGDGSATTN